MNKTSVVVINVIQAETLLPQLLLHSPTPVALLIKCIIIPLLSTSPSQQNSEISLTLVDLIQTRYVTNWLNQVETVTYVDRIGRVGPSSSSLSVIINET